MSYAKSYHLYHPWAEFALGGEITVKQRGELSQGRKTAWTQKSHWPLSFKECKWVLSDGCSDPSVPCFKSSGRHSHWCGARHNFPSINMDVGKCTVVGNMSIWTSCFPPVDEQCFLGDKHKCHVFYISAVDIIVWTAFNSESWERILFNC